jgi:hypothetical protein
MLSGLQRIREEMERAEARRLQPHYIESFFLEAFKHLGGNARQREPRRYEISHVPGQVRNRDRLIGIGEPVLPRYERIAFEKDCWWPRQGQPLAAFVCPGHPLLDAVTRPAGAQPRPAQARAVLVDERDQGTQPRRPLLPRTRHPGCRRQCRAANRRTISKRMLYVATGRRRARPSHIHYAPYLDYRPLTMPSPSLDSLGRPECAWIERELEARRRATPSPMWCPSTWQEVKRAKLELIAKTEAAVKDRLTKEITYWDHRAEELKLQEQAGKTNARSIPRGPQARRQPPGPAAEAPGGAQAARRRFAAVAAGGAGRAAGRATRPADRELHGRRGSHGPTVPPDTQAAAARARGEVVMEVERQSRLRRRPTASWKSSATTSRAATPAPAGSASSRSRDESAEADRRSPSPRTRSSTP